MTIIGDNYGEFDTETGEYISVDDMEQVARDERAEDRRKQKQEEASLDALLEEQRIVSKAMIKNGGSFVKCLGEALSHADEFNAQKIKDAFTDYWARYLKMR